MRSSILERLGGQAAPAGAPVRAAADGDALAIADPVDVTDPRGDIRQVLVGDGGGGSLRFTMQVEEYTNPSIDPAWVLGGTSALWAVDTSGDGEPELLIDFFNDGAGLVAFVVDAASLVVVCEAVPSTSGVTRTYTVTVTQPGCLGDVHEARRRRGLLP